MCHRIATNAIATCASLSTTALITEQRTNTCDEGFRSGRINDMMYKTLSLQRAP
jgi:hypothetical protein